MLLLSLILLLHHLVRSSTINVILHKAYFLVLLSILLLEEMHLEEIVVLEVVHLKVYSLALDV